MLVVFFKFHPEFQIPVPRVRIYSTYSTVGTGDRTSTLTSTRAPSSYGVVTRLQAGGGAHDTVVDTAKFGPLGWAAGAWAGAGWGGGDKGQSAGKSTPRCRSDDRSSQGDHTADRNNMFLS